MNSKLLATALLAVAAAQAELKVSANFPNGSVGQVSAVNPLHLRVGIKGQTDQDGRNRQASWYSFEVSGVPKGAEVIIDLVDLPGEYNYKANLGAITKDTRPYWKEGKKGLWQEALGDYDAEEPKWRLRIRPKKGTFLVAHIPPYTAKNLGLLRKELKPTIEVCGKTIGGKPLELWTFDLSGGKADAPVVWMMFRQHAWEAGTSWAGDGFMRNLPPGVVWKILPWNDPDGVDAGGVRFNQKGFDLNRNWDAPNDVSKRPEILAQKTAIEAWLKEGKKIDLFLTLHNTETGEYLEGPPDSKLGKDLYEVLKERTNFDPDRDYFSRMKVEGPGRANVIQWLWGTHKVPAMLMELRVAQSKKLGKRPGTDTWSKFGAELAKQIAALLLVAK
jgi:hypothetical protein